VLYGAREQQKDKKFRIRDTNIFNRIISRMKRWFIEEE
jgi:cell division protein FtsA